MSNFLIVMSAENEGDNTRLLFRYGVNIASKFLGSNSEVHVVETDKVCAASFNRTNGSQLKIVKDPEKHYWLLATGTWFYDNNIASGDEADLLNRFLKTNVVDVAKKLEGFYNIFIGNEKKNELYLITDITGSLHCYARDLGTATVLSGSSAILAALDNWSLDPVACQEFLYTGIIYENRTFYNEVKRLAPATIHTFSEGKHNNSQRYWNISDLEPDSIKGKHAPSLLYESICNATKKIISVFKNPICDLTGGYDSRVVFSSLISSGIKPATFVSGSSDSEDVKVSRAIASEFNVPHFHFTKNNFSAFSNAKEVLKYTDGEYDLFEYSAIYQGHMFALNKGYNSNIVGSFGELARGYWWDILYPNIGSFRPLDCRKVSRIKYSSHLHDASLFPSELKIDLSPHFANVVEKMNASVSHFPNTTQLDNNLLNMKIRC